MVVLALPPEGTYSDIEHDMIDNEPPGLFPGDQNSNWGQMRTVFAKSLQVLADMMTVWYEDLDPRTATDAGLTRWESALGIPDQSITGRTLAQRSAFVMARLERGPFTRTRRQNIVESFIAPVLGGVSIGFDSSGMPFTAGGTPFGSDISSLVGTYAIRENWPAKNKISNSSLEVNTTNWVLNGTGTTIARDLTIFKYGIASLKVITPGTVTDEGAYVGNPTPATILPSQPHVGSLWVYPTTSAILRAQVNTFNGGTFLTGFPGTPVTCPANTWTRLTVAFTSGATANLAQMFVLTQGTQAKTFYVDGAQLELAPLTDWSDPAGPSFFYEVRILNSLGVDTVGLTRELTRITPAGITFTVSLVVSP